MKPFIGRSRELKILDDLDSRSGAQFLVLYGRRRIGKTALVNQWQIGRKNRADKHTPTKSLYWMATQTSFTNQLRDFSQALFHFQHPNSTTPQSFSYQSWEEAFTEIGNMAERERVVLILDEFTYVMQANPEIASILQKVWDHQLQSGNLFLILSGSLAGMIERHILGYRAPLYGRATARLKLQPLPFGALKLLLPKMTTEQRVAVYTITGGIPAYIQPFDDSLNLIQNLQQRVVTPINVMLNDAVFLLREQVDEPRNYMAVIEAIANGNHKLADIAKSAGLDKSNVNRYLTILRELGYVERRVPATARHPERSRRGRHVIIDPYLSFYFRFLRPYLADIEHGRMQQVVDLLHDHLVDFIGTHTFEELCREWVRISTDLGEFAFVPERVGSHWAKDAQIDVVAINWRQKKILLGECKWGKTPIGVGVIEKLVERTAKVLPAGEWDVSYLLFTRYAPSAAVVAAAKKQGVELVSVGQIEEDIVRWMGGG